MVPQGGRVAAVPAGLELASFGRRILGSLLDQLLILLPVAVVAVAIGIRPGDELSDAELVWLNVATVAVGFAYGTVLVALTGRTVGKVATGTMVVGVDDGGRLGWFRSAQRALVPLVFGVVPEAGVVLGAVVYAAAFVDPLRRGIHDRAAGSLVVRHVATGVTS